ncbi:MAG TPA: hypothetical protein VKJ45_05580, partial [Blastocatellia bacterium]|nr:hypothetical protein [Blastocatellia bacterium]
MNRRRLVLGAAALAVAVLIVSWSLVRTRAQKPPDQTASQAQSQTPTVIVTNVVSQELSRQVRLPGDLKAYQDVAIYPKIPGFVEWIGVDRGSVVKRGQLIARMAAPEVEAQSGEAASKAQAAHSQRLEAEARAGASKSQRVEAEAKLASDEATYRHLRGAAETPGVVAGNDVEVAEKT